NGTPDAVEPQLPPEARFVLQKQGSPGAPATQLRGEQVTAPVPVWFFSLASLLIPKSAPRPMTLAVTKPPTPLKNEPPAFAPAAAPPGDAEPPPPPCPPDAGI